MNLTILIIVPLVAALALIPAKGQQARLIALLGASVQLMLSFVLLYLFYAERSAGNVSPMRSFC
jgi:hypothetical protein